MEVFAPKKFEQFIDTFNRFKNSGHHYFRGQANSEWSIIPGLGRNRNNINFALLKIEQTLSKKFKEKIFEKQLSHLIPINKVSYHETWQWLMAAQHYGLPTRLIDFSHDRFAALEFAVADLQQLNSHGALIIHSNPNSTYEDDTSKLLKEPCIPIDKTFFFQVPAYGQDKNNECNLSEKRKLIHGSKFLHRETTKITECLSLDNDHSTWLTKIHIPKELKPQIIEYLIGINRLAFDIYAGKNAIDYYAAILKNDFINLNSNNLKKF